MTSVISLEREKVTVFIREVVSNRLREPIIFTDYLWDSITKRIIQCKLRKEVQSWIVIGTGKRSGLLLVVDAGIRFEADLSRSLYGAGVIFFELRGDGKGIFFRKEMWGRVQ